MFAEFELEMPEQLKDALHILADGKGGSLLAGGTNLLLDMRSRKERPERVIALGDIGELRGITVENNRITLGSRTTVSELL
ncbi:MAG: FAD binding domain-containing protein, partial [Alphaproteobacteria bacterium]